jgi:glycosyltransferase involved in cell wall biosynthesis
MADPTWHLVTCEYAPQIGGVADFTRAVAGGLAAAGQRVHVWSPSPAVGNATIAVHALPDGYKASALAFLDRALDACPPPRRLFVQWVPHGYGYKSLNVPFCLWVRRRARRGDNVHLMVHEPFLSFDSRRIRQNIGAAMHRAMLGTLLGAARRVWVSTPSFLADVRRFGAGQRDATWLPIPSPVARVDDPRAVAALRARWAAQNPVVGYFGTCNPLVAPLLAAVISELASIRPEVRWGLFGRGTQVLVADLLARRCVPQSTIMASGELGERELSLALQCCDVFVQPYHDGLSTRRTTLMALLDHGRPVVSPRGLRTEALWQQAGSVRLTPADDVAALVEATISLLDHPNERAELAARGRAQYAERFEIGRAVAALLADTAH